MLGQCLVIVEIQSPLITFAKKDGVNYRFLVLIILHCSHLVHSLCYAHTYTLPSTLSTRCNSAYAGKKGIDVNSMRFMLDGEAVEFDSTPESLDLEDNDQIDCFLQQVGGADDDEGAEDTKAEDAPITIRVKDQTGEETMFKIKKSTKMKKVSV